jgi:hypothetical protein
MFTHPYISSELARDRQRELLAQASRQRVAKAYKKDFNRPGTLMIGVAFGTAVLAATLVPGLTKVHGDVNQGAAPAAATVSISAAQPFTGTGIALTSHDDESPKAAQVSIALTADEHFTAPATGKRAHQPVVQKVRDDAF